MRTFGKRGRRGASAASVLAKAVQWPSVRPAGAFRAGVPVTPPKTYRISDPRGAPSGKPTGRSSWSMAWRSANPHWYDRACRSVRVAVRDRGAGERTAAGVREGERDDVPGGDPVTGQPERVVADGARVRVGEVAEGVVVPARMRVHAPTCPYGEGRFR
ncbi:hypothetical protein [Streptomyces sp. enrichment culture]|uniref:hypothetical protein n=1 Tax=Streptomyces sp. enrichment culture TaxID=1795815 RepID=UPI003F560C1A